MMCCDKHSIFSSCPWFFITLGHSSNFLADGSLPYFLYCWVVLDFSVLCDNFLRDWMHNTVRKVFYSSIVVVGKASWACCGELVGCLDGLVASVVDIICHQVVCFLWYHIGCRKWDSWSVGCCCQWSCLLQVRAAAIGSLVRLVFRLNWWQQHGVVVLSLVHVPPGGW
jgi:hypothetical protein